MINKITNSLVYIGCDDADLDLFESQFVVPNGMAYNSYAIMDEKICIMDTVDKRAGADEVKGGEIDDEVAEKIERRKVVIMRGARPHRQHQGSG